MSSSLAFAPLAKPLSAAPAGRLKQSAARWCYGKIPMDDLCRQAAELGLSGLDLVDEKDWATCKKYGLVPAMVTGAGNHSRGAGIARRTTTSSKRTCATTSPKPPPPKCPT